MPLNYTPISWKNVNPEDPRQMKVFLLQLSDFLNSAFNPAFLAFSLNGQGLLSPGAMSSAANTLIGNNTGSTAPDSGLTVTQVLTMLSLKTVSTDLGVVTTNQSVACDNASFITANMQVNTAVNLSLTLTHLTVGSPFYAVRFVNGGTGAVTFILGATNPAGTAYPDMLAMVSADTQIGLTTGGVAIAAGGARIVVGSTISIGGSPRGIALIL